MFEYPVDIARDSNGSFYVAFPDIPEAHTLGETKDEALRMPSRHWKPGCRFTSITAGICPKRRRGRPLVGPTIKGAMKLGIYQAMKEQNIRKTDLARRLDCHLMQIDRLLNLCHSSRIEQLEAAFAASNRKVHLEMEPA